MFSREEIDFLVGEAELNRDISEKYRVKNPGMSEHLKKKAATFQMIAEKIDRLVAAIELR